LELLRLYGTAPVGVIYQVRAISPSTGVLFGDGFDGSSLGAGWTTVGGHWEQSGGVLRQTGLWDLGQNKADVAGVALPTDVEVTARVRVDTWAGDDARVGVSLGDDAAGVGYDLVFHRDTDTVQFLHDYVAWGDSYAFAWRVGTWYRFRLRQSGGVLDGKVWEDGQAEPASWMFRQEGWAPRSGAAGLTGGSYGGSTASFDDFAATGG